MLTTDLKSALLLRYPLPLYAPSFPESVISLALKYILAPKNLVLWDRRGLRMHSIALSLIIESAEAIDSCMACKWIPPGLDEAWQLSRIEVHWSLLWNYQFRYGPSFRCPISCYFSRGKDFGVMERVFAFMQSHFASWSQFLEVSQSMQIEHAMEPGWGVKWLTCTFMPPHLGTSGVEVQAGEIIIIILMTVISWTAPAVYLTVFSLKNS